MGRVMNAAGRHCLRLSVHTRFCNARSRRRMRTAALVLAGLCLLLVLILSKGTTTTTTICSASTCKTPQARETFLDKSAFVTTFPHRDWRPGSSSSTKRILRWTGFFSDPTWEDTDDRYFAACEESRCTMTNDRTLLDQTDAVLFNGLDVFNFGRGVVMPDRRRSHQVWILYNTEPPTRTPLNLGLLAGVFNWTAYYRQDSDVPVLYGGYIHYPGGDRYGANRSINHARRRPRLAAWMSSNCYDYNRRQLLVHRLKSLLGDDLDLYGGCGSKRCPETICADTLSNYKFFLALENSRCRDYVTEKFWAALSRQQVPVVLGGASSHDYRKIAPPNSFLHVDDFPSLEDLASHLRFLSQNEAAYNRHLEWTRHYEIHSEVPARRQWWCDLCQALHNKSRPAQVYSDLQGWLQNDACPQWTMANQLSRIMDGLKIKMGLS